MAEKPESSPFASLLTSDLYTEWRAHIKQMVINSLETNEKIAKASLARYETAMAWTKDTPWAPWCTSVVATTGTLIKDASKMFSTMWRLEPGRDGPEKMSKV